MRSILLLGLCLLANPVLAATQPDPFPQVASSYWVEINGTPLWAKQADHRLPQASLTKLMTVFLTLEQAQMEDTITINPSATRETGSHLGLKTGERFRIKDMLAASLLPSANDACHALADHLAGDEASFVKRMNQRAQTLGMRNTHFSNACGHDEINHYSSARDLSLLAHALLQHPSLLDITAQHKTEITTLDGHSRYQLYNKNALIGRYDGALGLKTGYTPNAGKCLVAYAKRGEHEVLLVMLHGHDRWWDAADILDLAFAHVPAH